MHPILTAAQSAAEPERTRLINLYASIQLRQSILSCDRCSLRAGCRAPVPWSGPFPHTLAFIGEAPGKDEDLHGAPFVGTSGDILRAALILYGQHKHDFPIWNVAACRPPGNRTPYDAEVEACHTWFRAQLDLVNPSVIVPLGRTAAVKFKPDIKITQERGVPFDWEGRIVIPTFHPSYVARGKQQREGLFHSDIGLALLLMWTLNTFPGARISTHSKFTHGAGDTFAMWRDKHLPEIQSQHPAQADAVVHCSRMIARHNTHPYWVRLFEELAGCDPVQYHDYMSTHLIQGSLL